MSILYFLQRPREVPMSVYKIGMSTQGLNRFKAADYRDAEFLFISQVDDAARQERELIKLFDKNFPRAKDVYEDKTFGDEDYYITDLAKAKKLFAEYILKQQVLIKQDELNLAVVLSNLFISVMMLVVIFIKYIIDFVLWVKKSLQ